MAMRWHWAKRKLHDPRYAALTASARGVMCGLEELLAETGEVQCTLKMLASWLCADKKLVKASLDAISASGVLTIERQDDLYIISGEGYGEQRRPPIEGWQRLRAIVFERDGYACCYCGATASPLECDHITPVSRGGTNDLENLTTACKPCNRSKGAKMLNEWRPKDGMD